MFDWYLCLLCIQCYIIYIEAIKYTLTMQLHIIHWLVWTVKEKYIVATYMLNYLSNYAQQVQIQRLVYQYLFTLILVLPILAMREAFAKQVCRHL